MGYNRLARGVHARVQRLGRDNHPHASAEDTALDRRLNVSFFLSHSFLRGRPSVTQYLQVSMLTPSCRDGCIVRLYAKHVTDCSGSALGEREYNPYCTQSDLSDVGSIMLDCSKLYGEKLVMS